MTRVLSLLLFICAAGTIGVCVAADRGVPGVAWDREFWQSKRSSLPWSAFTRCRRHCQSEKAGRDDDHQFLDASPKNSGRPNQFKPPATRFSTPTFLSEACAGPATGTSRAFFPLSTMLPVRWLKCMGSNGYDRTGNKRIACYRITKHDGWDASAAFKEAAHYGMSQLERGMRLSYVADFARQSADDSPDLPKSDEQQPSTCGHRRQMKLIRGALRASHHWTAGHMFEAHLFGSPPLPCELLWRHKPHRLRQMLERLVANIGPR